VHRDFRREIHGDDFTCEKRRRFRYWKPVSHNVALDSASSAPRLAWDDCAQTDEWYR
jgi:hypothetical protein